LNSSQQQLEQIVAYLDGELTAEESAQVEQRLAADKTFRQELQGAQRAWTALDELPMAVVGDDFSHSTLEMVVCTARRDVEARTIALPIEHRKRSTTTLLLVAMAVLLGVLVFRVLGKNPNRRLLADLPVIQNVDIYSQFRSLDFLRHLERLLNEPLEVSTGEALLLQAKSAEFLVVSTEGKREEWLELLPDDKKIVLRAKLNRFRDLSPQRQDEMRQLHQQLDTAEDRDPLLKTMFHYQQWLSELTPSKQYELRDLQAIARAHRVDREMKNAASAQKFKLTTQQLDTLFRKIRPPIEQLVQRMRSTLERGRSKMQRRKKWGIHPLSLHAMSLSEQTRPEQVRRVLMYAARESPEDFKKLSDAIVEALPVEMGQAFQKLTPQQKIERMRAWAWQFRFEANGKRRTGRKGNPRSISEQELSDFFVALDPAEKERLLALTRDKMQELLRSMVQGKIQKL